MRNDLNEVLDDVGDEVLRARKFEQHANPYHSFAVLLEEVDELKAHVWMKQEHRDLDAMRKEAIQVAAMAVRFVTDVCNEERGRK